MKYLIINILFAAFSISAGAQDMADLFIKMPDASIIGLEDAWRKDLVDLYKAGKEAKLKNLMQGTSHMTQLTSDYMELQTSERSTIELKRLPLINNTYIICMITTVSAPAPDSRVDFFTTDWKKLPDTGLYIPVSAKDFIRSDVDTTDATFHDIMAALDIALFRYRLSADALTLTAEYTTPQYLNEDMREKAKPFLKKKPKIYTWKTGRFE